MYWVFLYGTSTDSYNVSDKKVYKINNHKCLGSEIGTKTRNAPIGFAG